MPPALHKAAHAYACVWQRSCALLRSAATSNEQVGVALESTMRGASWGANLCTTFESQSWFHFRVNWATVADVHIECHRTPTLIYRMCAAVAHDARGQLATMRNTR